MQRGAITAGGDNPPADRQSGEDARILLEMEGVTKLYGSFKALEDMRLQLREGEVHVLFGENGAGKSTLIQIMAGLQPFNSGTYRLFGRDIDAAHVSGTRHDGISVVFQEFSLVPELTVAENMFLGHEITAFGRLSKTAMLGKVKEILEELGFPLDPNDKIINLRRAHQQMVEIAKALLHDCKVLILDEPTASLTDHEASHLFDLVERLRAGGMGIIYVSHRMSEIDRLADRITILRDGRYIATVNNHEVDHAKLVELMTGRSFDKFFPDITRKVGAERLRFQNVSLADGTARDINLTVRSGEVLGLAGLAGCGKSEVIRAAFGLNPLSGGMIAVKGGVGRNQTPGDALRSGIIYFPSDRATEGLAMRQSLVSNSTVAAMEEDRFSRFKMVLRRSAERLFTKSVVKQFNVRTPSIDIGVESLSGGNKQKVMLARGMSRDFDVFLFDEPTVGVDVQAKLEIYDFIKDLTEAGKAVVIASSELAEVLHMSHRLVVMQEGAIVGELEGDDITEDKVLSLFFSHADQTPSDYSEAAQ